MRLTVPVTSSSPRDRKSLRICSRSASRMRCSSTCLAVCAPMRRGSIGSIGSSINSSSLASAFLAAPPRRRDLRRRAQTVLVGHDLPAPEGVVVAGVVVDRDAHVDVLEIALLQRRGERHLERREHDVPRHVLLARQRVRLQSAILDRVHSATLQFRHQPRPFHVRQVPAPLSARPIPSLRGHRLPRAALPRTAAAPLHPACASAPPPVAGEAHEVRALAQRPVEARARTLPAARNRFPRPPGPLSGGG